MFAKERKPQWSVRLAEEKDIPAILDVELSCYLPFVWHGDYKRWILHDRSTFVWVAETKPHGKVVGFLVYRLFTSKVGLVRLGVHEAYRREGYGGLMMYRLMEKFQQSPRRDKMICFVHEKALSVQMFLKDQGFTAMVSKSYTEYIYMYYTKRNEAQTQETESLEALHGREKASDNG